MGLNESMRSLIERLLTKRVWVPAEPQGTGYAIRRYGHLLIPFWIMLLLFVATGVLQEQIEAALGQLAYGILQWGSAVLSLLLGVPVVAVLNTDNLKIRTVLLLAYGPMLVVILFAITLNAIAN